METNSRKINVKISGVPMESNENCGKIIQKLPALVKVENFDKNSIDVTHRLKTDAPRTPAIIVKFTTRTDRDRFFSNRRNLKDFTLSHHLGYSEKKKLFINESLPVDTKILFKETREICSRANFKYCFTSGGVVYAQKEKDARKILIFLNLLRHIYFLSCIYVHNPLRNFHLHSMKN